jgi:hypothetical protein
MHLRTFITNGPLRTLQSVGRYGQHGDDINLVQVEQEGGYAIAGDGEVIVRQEDEEARNDLIIEGSLTRLYYQVRDEVYKQYRLVPVVEEP